MVILAINLFFTLLGIVIGTIVARKIPKQDSRVTQILKFLLIVVLSVSLYTGSDFVFGYIVNKETIKSDLRAGKYSTAGYVLFSEFKDSDQEVYEVIIEKYASEQMLLRAKLKVSDPTDKFIWQTKYARFLHSDKGILAGYLSSIISFLRDETLTDSEILAWILGGDRNSRIVYAMSNNQVYSLLARVIASGKTSASTESVSLDQSKVKEFWSSFIAEHRGEYDILRHSSELTDPSLARAAVIVLYNQIRDAPNVNEVYADFFMNGMQ